MSSMRVVCLVAIAWSFLSSATACNPAGRCRRNESVVEKRISFKGHEIYFEVRGSGPRTLFFIHGWTGNSGVWKYQLDAFPEYRVIAIDLPGNGKSSRVIGASYSMELFADTVREVLLSEKVDKAFLFGHSMGFAVVEVIAAKYPEICRGIGSIDGAHFEVPTDSEGFEKWKVENKAMSQSMTTERARDDFINMLFLPDTPTNLKNEILQASREVPLGIGRAMIEGVVEDAKYWLPKKVEIPCLAVYSPAYGLPTNYPDDFAVTFPLVEYHDVKNVSHFFMLEIPYALNQLIYDFVERY